MRHSRPVGTFSVSDQKKILAALKAMPQTPTIRFFTAVVAAMPKLPGAVMECLCQDFSELSILLEDGLYSHAIHHRPRRRERIHRHRTVG